MLDLKRILVPTDLTDPVENILQYAFDLAKKYEAQVHLLHVSSGATEVGDTLRALQVQFDPSRHPEQTIVPVVREGTPAQEILRYAEQEQVGLIVMGTHGRSGLAYAFLGSVAEKVIRSAPCPVLIARPVQGTIPRVTLRKEAAEALRDQFRESLPGDRASAIDQMKAFLSQRYRIAMEEAAALLNELESYGTLRWSHNSGEEAQEAGGTEPRWQIDPDIFNDSNDANQALMLLARAMEAHASDIHIDPEEQDVFHVRFRIDGHLESYCHLHRSMAAPMIQQFKILADLDIAEPFKPNEGRLRLPASLSDVEARITTIPVSGGHAVALRLQSRQRLLLPLQDLGLSPRASESVAHILQQGSGLVLVTGPTGAGKTTTVYTLLHLLAKGDRNLVAIEDPIEFRLPFLRQTAVDPRHGLTMTSALRTVLRMDPDVVFVSEVRGVEEASIAMRAASSGRYVLSTLHTRDVASTVTALRDLAINDLSLGANLSGILCQRLVRRLCLDCSQRVTPNEDDRRAFLAEGLEPPAELAQPAPKGCSRCRKTGYRGRIGVFEVVPTAGEIAEAIQRSAPEDEVRSLIRQSGTPSLLGDALAKAQEGITSLEEALSMKWV